MRKLLLFVILLPLFARAQDTLTTLKLPIDTVTHIVTYQQIVTTPGISKAELYSKAREWFALNFKAANKVLQMDDKENGKLIGKGAFTGMYNYKGGFGMSVPIEYNVLFTLNITVKDFKYRIVITDYAVKNSQSSLETPIESYLSEPDVPKVKKYSKYIIESRKMRSVILDEVNTNGLSTLESIKNFMLNPKKDDF